ncbi:MAG: hypothetical protein JSV96_12470 [Candidatus Aminicenantes bacterium]|nr:MAG: hypothetical protein JSV96_12470 [Candidatus Aminicenantes bacterium]
MTVKIHMTIFLWREYLSFLKNVPRGKRSYGCVLVHYYYYLYKIFYTSIFGKKFFVLLSVQVGLYVFRKKLQIYAQYGEGIFFPEQTYLQMGKPSIPIALGYKSELKRCFNFNKITFNKVNLINNGIGKVYFPYFFDRFAQIICKYRIKIAQRGNLWVKKRLIIHQCPKSAQSELRIIVTGDFNKLKLWPIAFNNILMEKRAFSSKPVIIFQRIGRKILYQFPRCAKGYRKKFAIQSQFFSVKKGEVFQKHDFLQSIEKWRYFRYWVSRNPGGQYDPKLFTSNRSTN